MLHITSPFLMKAEFLLTSIHTSNSCKSVNWVNTNLHEAGSLYGCTEALKHVYTYIYITIILGLITDI